MKTMMVVMLSIQHRREQLLMRVVVRVRRRDKDGETGYRNKMRRKEIDDGDQDRGKKWKKEE